MFSLPANLPLCVCWGWGWVWGGGSVYILEAQLLEKREQREGCTHCGRGLDVTGHPYQATEPIPELG